MKCQRRTLSFKKRNSKRGMTFVETVVALAILLVATAGVMNIAAIAIATTENQGHLAARTAEYAQDKMEQLLGLTYCDGGTTGASGTDTTVFPSAVGAGSGLAGCTNLAAAIPTALTGGGLNTSNPVVTPAPYVDYLDASGNLVGATGNWEYVRVWQISIPTGATATSGLKQVSVKVQARVVVGQNILPPQATVVALKTYPF